MQFLSMEELFSRRGRGTKLTERRGRSVLPPETRRRARSLLDGEDAEDYDEGEWEEEDEWEEMNDDEPVDIIVHEGVLPEPRPDGLAPR